MKAFASWSGGKDCMLAIHRFSKNPNNELMYLVNMCDDEGESSRSHGLKKEIIAAQANSMGIKIIQKATHYEGYEKKFKEVISELKKEGITAGVFGDIYLEAHRVWIVRVCTEMEIEAIFPLWLESTTDLMTEFIDLGFKTITVAIRNTKLSDKWLGRIIDLDFLNEITQLKDIDPCAENGEYHSFVFDGPNFKKSIPIKIGEKRIENNTTFITISL